MTASLILVVEDNPLNLQLVRDVLELHGHEVIQAVDVDEGRARLRERLPDLVLLDIALPGGGGEALLAEIRANPAQAALPVVAMTAFAMPGDRERLIGVGFDGYLSKPIDVRSFAPTVEGFIKPRAG